MGCKHTSGPPAVVEREHPIPATLVRAPEWTPSPRTTDELRLTGALTDLRRSLVTREQDRHRLKARVWSRITSLIQMDDARS